MAQKAVSEDGKLLADLQVSSTRGHMAARLNVGRT